MTPPSTCLECNAPLTAADAGGLCPKCLLRLGLASQLASGTLPATAPGLTPDGAVREPFDFGGYRIERLLGKGGMGAVYEAEHGESGRRVALKVLGHTLDTPEMRARFLREGQLAAGVRHANVVAVLGAEEIEGAPVIAMELLHDGTLKDRVKKRGPLPPAEAVDAVLQIIDGLEAAHANGVLHRDVKPANCFSTTSGVVKVGDFGLSISTLAKAEHSLTQSGAVLGTPAFAAPEQLRGEEIDARADIYAVGATLYFLLTGKPTHDAETLVGLISAVLTQRPAPVRALRPELPRGLAAAVMRCLEKDRAARFAGYAELRAALAPFGSAAPTPATVGLRFVAGVIDCTLVALPELAFALAGSADSDWLARRDAASFGWMVLSAVFFVAYFAVPETIWGRTLGKMICGLRVQRLGGGPPEAWRATARSLIFNIELLVTPVLGAMLYSAAEMQRELGDLVLGIHENVALVLSLLLFVTMRRKNGYATVHDLLTGTRVVAAETAQAPLPLAFLAPHRPAGAAPERIGAFAVVARGDGLIQALDENLQRRVWIVPASETAPAMAPARREIGRPTRLVWLQGRRQPGEAWDAFEAPAGMALVELLDGRQPWTRVRRWLRDLAEEMSAGLRDGTLPAEIGADFIWITSDGHAVLLDFPAPGAAPRPRRTITDTRDVQTFLHEIAEAALEPAVPLHARELLGALREGRLEAPEIVAGNVNAVATRIAHVTPGRRGLSLILGPALAAAMCLLVALVTMEEQRRFDRWWSERHPSLPPIDRALGLLNGLTPDQERRLHQHLAGHFREVIADDSFWAAPEVQTLLWPDTSATKKRAREIVAKHPQVTAAELADADAALEREFFVHYRGWKQQESFLFGMAAVFGVLAAAGLVSIFFTLASGVPPGLRLCGLALVDQRGAPASRWRAASRSLAGWAPVIVAFLAISLGGYYGASGESLVALSLAVVAGFFVALVWTIRRPDRGPLDAIFRTRVVPV